MDEVGDGVELKDIVAGTIKGAGIVVISSNIFYVTHDYKLPSFSKIL